MWIPIAALAFSTTVQASEAPGVSARAAAVIDVDTNQLLYEKNADQRMLIASLTKVMTAIVALEHDSIADVVTVDQDSYGKEGSSIYLQLGQKISLENLLYGLMLRSGNDAASAIAKHVGGSEAGFVAMMNDTARYIGMRNTHFANPHGLDAPEHYSTARDMALLTAYAMMNPTFREIVKTPYKRITYDDQHVSYLWRNKNKMLRLFEGADGVKTGFTKRAGRCLISSATRDGKQIVVVTLKASSDWVDHRHLLQYGFQQGE
jgi:D-alanyl-D-alanine carboxypeptidase